MEETININRERPASSQITWSMVPVTEAIPAYAYGQARFERPEPRKTEWLQHWAARHTWPTLSWRRFWCIGGSEESWSLFLASADSTRIERALECVRELQ